MNALLTRILKYMNGALFYDDHYQFCAYLIDHYLEMETMTKEQILRETGIHEEEMDKLISRLGCGFDWEKFQQTFIQHHQIRLDQIRGRMVGIRPEDLVKVMQKSMSDEEMLNFISIICKELANHKRTVLIGGLYAMSVAAEFQTDLITCGKNVVQFHHFDPNMHFTKEDLLIVISMTGIELETFLQRRADLHPKQAETLLITQNPAYQMEEHKISNQVLLLPGRYEELEFHYQVMQVFDLLRIQYYQQFYLDWN